MSVDWLADHLEAHNLVILDASLPKAGMGEDTLTDLMIRNGRFMDLKNQWARKKAQFPNTMLSPGDFEEAARSLGINNNSAIVAYDQHGIYSSARAWYMFRAMGHENIAVLDGGLPAWESKGFPVEVKAAYTGREGDFKSKPRPGYFVDYKQVLAGLEDPRSLVLDARASDRFFARVEEPRPGLRSGHIPNSFSLPFGDLQADGCMKDRDSLMAIFSERTSEDQTLVFSCGSGITACVLALGASLAERDKIAVYDGSWTEWGSLPELPIEKD